MLHLLRRHPIPIAAHFRHSLVLTYAMPPKILEPLLPCGSVSTGTKKPADDAGPANR